MAMFHFGERRPTTTVRGEPTQIGEYALHVQCAWRITSGDTVVTARRDLYYPADGSEPTDDFDWEHAPNRQDKVLDDVFRQQKIAPVVQRIEVAEAARLHIALSFGFALDIMPDDSTAGEHWRLFVPRLDEPHFVVTGKGIEIE
jgi:hypothetical protein